MERIDNFNSVRTNSEIANHVVFAGMLPIFDFLTDLSVLPVYYFHDYKEISYITLFWLIIPTLGRILFMLKDRARCPRGSKPLGVLMHILHVHPIYNVWTDCDRGEKSEGTTMTMLLEFMLESLPLTGITLCFMLTPEGWRTWSITWDPSNLLIICSLAVSMVSLGYGALTLTIKKAHRHKWPGVVKLRKSLLKQIVFVTYFIVSALLLISAHVLFAVAFFRWYYLLYFADAMIVRPLAARMCGLIHERMVPIKNILIGSSFLGFSWVYMDFPFLLVKDDNGKDWARGTLMCDDISVLKSWLMIAFSICAKSSYLGDEDWYTKILEEGGATPKTALQESPWYFIVGGITLMKCITGYIMFTHWVEAQRAADLVLEQLDQQGRENPLTQEQAVEKPVRAGELDAILEHLFGPDPAEDPPIPAVPDTVVFPSAMAADLAMEQLEQQRQMIPLTWEPAVEEPVRASELDAILEQLFGPAPAEDPPSQLSRTLLSFHPP